LRTADELAAERRPNMDPPRDILLAEQAGGVLGVSFASWAVRDDVLSLDTEGAVIPSARRQGIGTELLRRQQAGLAERTVDIEPGRKRLFGAWVSDTQVGARALLERDGYAAVRFAFDMIKRGLDDVPDAPVPPGLVIRAPEPPEIGAILAAEEEAFRDHPGHREWTEGDTATTLESPYYDPTLWRVAWDGDEIAGVVENWVYRDENDRLGFNRAWLNRVSVRRPWRKRGLARALIAASFVAVRARGIEDACLGVDANNPSGALRLYESMGFEQLLSGRMYVRDAPR
jgi:mycothiol synthase